MFEASGAPLQGSRLDASLTILTDSCIVQFVKTSQATAPMKKKTPTHREPAAPKRKSPARPAARTATSAAPASRVSTGVAGATRPAAVPARRKAATDAAAAVAEPAVADSLLDAAADLASQHPALEGKRSLLRSLLAFEAERDRLSLALGGGPRRVLRAEDLASERQARLAGESIARIWEEEMLEPSAAAVALGASAGNRQRVADLRQRSVLLGLPHGNRYLYPSFQFDLERRTVRPEVESVNRLLEAAADPWGAASWWTCPNAWLGGAQPMDLAGTGRAAELVTAAETLLEPAG
jgi:hypothetical protein